MNVYRREKPYYCVYAHFVRGRLLYIGCGSPERAYSLAASGRNVLWRKAVKKRSDIGVVIIRRFCCSIVAGRYEQRMIDEYKPPANIMFTGYKRQYRHE